MKRYQGKVLSRGIAIGQIQVWKKEKQEACRTQIADSKQEIQRVNEAAKEAKKQLQELFEKALLEAGEASAAIFEVHQMLLEDTEYREAIQNMIQTQKVNAEYAIAVTADNLANAFAMMDDAYLKERATDVKDVSERLISILQNAEAEKIITDTHVIVIANELSPAETVQMDNQVKALVTRHGSAHSHTAILARAMNLPALAGLDYEEELDGKIGIVDGFLGELIVDPTQALLKDYQRKIAAEEEKKRQLQELKGKESKTRSGKKVRLCANISGISELQAAIQNGAEGIGLFRSEFLYLRKNQYPTEEEQLQVYQSVVKAMAGRRVIIRTLDVGADKQVDYFGLAKEDNPALGYRAIRICLTRPELFKTQLRALYRASAFGKLGIMFPMIISIDEVKRIKEIVEEVKRELIESKVKIGEVELGVMIETPAAVMISKELAREVDFFSIGTNDLTQYTLAIDRQNAALSEFYDSHHPAILKMIQLTIENAHKGGAWVGICGELSADLTLTDTFIEMGVDELSVSPAFLLPLKKKIREHE